MDGKTLKAGCCTLVEDINHPISLARLVMEKTVHRFLGGKGVMKFAREQNVEILSPPGQLVTDYAREALEEFKEQLQRGHDVTNAPTEIGKRDEGGVGTVGAIAIDSQGNVAAATSTGGITGKLPGRIGDTPILGAGTYADNVSTVVSLLCRLANYYNFRLQLSGAVSTTGYGETIMQFNVAQRIIQRMELLKEDAQTATERVLEDMTRRLTFTAGAITIDTSGKTGIYWTSEKMAWAYQKGDKIHSGIRRGTDCVEDA